MENKCIKCDNPLPRSGYCYFCKIYYIDPDNIQDLNEVIKQIDYQISNDDPEDE